MGNHWLLSQVVPQVVIREIVVEDLLQEIREAIHQVPPEKTQFHPEAPQVRGKQIQQIHPLHQERKVVPKGGLLHQRHLNQLLIRQAIIVERRLKRLTPHQKQLIPVEEVLLLLRWVVIKYQIGRRQKTLLSALLAANGTMPSITLPVAA